jgi:DNA-binding NtrC family response regulator
MREAILAVDDALSMRVFYERTLGSDYDVLAVAGAEEGLELVGEREFDLFIVDLIMPGMGGVAFLEEARRLAPRTPSIVVSGTESLDEAIAAFRRRPFEFLRKPVDGRVLLMTVGRALAHAQAEHRVRVLRHELSGASQRWAPVMGPNPEMRDLWERVRLIAEHGGKSPVLILGESGTGKELVARGIHYWSPRRRQPFISVNCATLDRELSASLLFGIGRGVATGVEERMGKFEAAQGGTLFLDEIADLDPSVQVMLLRVLQEGVFQPVGSHREIAADVRVLAATNVDLRRAVREGRFRQDLYYRLSVVPVEVPPLRERKDDIPALVEHFMEKHGRGASPDRRKLLTPHLIRTFQRYDWPGNIRQLENAVLNMIITGIPPTLEQLEGWSVEAGGGPGDRDEDYILVVGRPWFEIEREVLQRNYERYRGNLRRMSEELGIPKSTLYAKVRRFRIRGD